MQSVRSDVETREAREFSERNSDSCEGCARYRALYAVGYRMVALADPSQVADKPIRTVAQYPGSCVGCGREVRVGDMIVWLRGAGTKCASCGGTR